MNKICYLGFFLFIQVLIFSSAPLPLRLQLYSGYREDQFSFKLVTNTDEELLIYREKYDHPRYFLTGASLTTLNNGFYFLTDLSYATLLSHKMHLTDTDSSLNHILFTHKARGYDLGSYGEVGVAANLTPDRIYSFYIIFLAGYSGFWKAYKRSNESSAQYIDLQNILAQSSLVDRKLKQIWYGPYVGGKILIMPNSSFSIDLSYHFNWMKLKLRFIADLEIVQFDPNGLILHELITKDMNDTFSGCFAHFAQIKVTFNTFKKIKIALFARYDYYLSDMEKAVLTSYLEEFFPEKNRRRQNRVNRLFSRWWNLMGAFELILQF